MANTNTSDQPIKLGVPNVGHYEGPNPLKGWTVKDTMLKLVIPIAGLTGCGFIGYKFYKYVLVNKTNENSSKNQINVHHEASHDHMNEDDNHTDNKIKQFKAFSEIRLSEKMTMIELEKERYVKQVAQPVQSGSLRNWIDYFHSTHTMPNLDHFEILSDIMNGCPDGYEDAMLLHCLSMFGTMCFSRVRSKHLDGKMHAPNIMVVIEGKRGSGKDKFTTVYNTLFKRIIEDDRMKLKYESCDNIIQTAGIRVSASQFYDILAHNRGVHIYAYESEISEVKDAFSKKGSLTPTILRKAFDNDVIYQNNKNKNAVKGAYNVFFNYTFTGTPEAVDSFFTHKEEEGGTARRQCFTVIPELELFPPTMNLPYSAELEAMRDRIDEWRGKYCITSKTPVIDEPCREHQINLNYVCDALDDWGSEQYMKYKDDGNTIRNGMRLAIGTIAFHCAMVLHMLAGEPQPNDRAKRKAVKDMALYIADYCMERYLTKFSDVTIPHIEQPTPQAETPNPLKRKLTQEEIEEWYFKRGTLNESGQVIGYGTIAKTLGVHEDEVKNAFRKYAKQLAKGVQQ